MIADSALSAIRQYVAKAFSAGTSTFPHYTLHGAEHLEELDRLALLVGDFTPDLSRDRLNLLRLAIILHDFAMVDVPSPNREAELRLQMGVGVSFADIVRKTHQDEIERSFTKPERINLLLGLIPTAGAQILKDASTIARHHRFHPLDKAPEHLRGLCALMRILDELDIGPRRAPQPAYETLRSRMDATSRFHWLKHICTRAVDHHGLLSVEQRDHRRILKVFVGVEATERTWRPIQENVLSKLRECLEREGVNDILRSSLNIEFELARAPEPELSGVNPFLAPIVREDLDLLPDDLIRPKSAQPITTPHLIFLSPPPSAVSRSLNERPAREFKIVALPPELLAERLCLSGRLTLIGNKYIQPEEGTAGGLSGAPNRIYVGPADSGKTRAALEWVSRLTEGARNQWVILRTSMGAIPENIENIVLDTSHYEKQQYLLPQKAILFLDDLPTNLPPAAGSFSATDAIRILFRWYNDLPYFRERRLVGTLRLEDTHALPEWPEVLPSLGQQLELVRLNPLDKDRYRGLWEGMVTGATSRKISEGVLPFRLELSQNFINVITEQVSDPEAVAVFIQSNVSKEKKNLVAEDANRFPASATLTWAQETWPALLEAYDNVAIRVFFTLARFCEAGLRPSSGFMSILGPRWEIHTAFGPELCKLRDGIAENYLPLLSHLLEDGHASGETSCWIRPRFDFLLQADDLAITEVSIPQVSWFADRASRLEPYTRLMLAYHLAGGPHIDSFPILEDAAWLAGYGAALIRKAEAEKIQEERQRITRSTVSILEHCLDLNPRGLTASTNLSKAKLMMSGSETNKREKARLKSESIFLARTVVENYPGEANAWYCLGYSLGYNADEEPDQQIRRQFIDESINCYRKSAEILHDSPALEAISNRLRLQALDEQDFHRRQKLRDESISVVREAISHNSESFMGWLNLSASLIHKAAESTEVFYGDLLDEAVFASRRGLELRGDDLGLHYNLSLALYLKAKIASLQEAKTFLDEAIDTSNRAITFAPTEERAWDLLALALVARAELEDDRLKTLELRKRAVMAYETISELDPLNASAWEKLAATLDLIKEELQSAKERIALGEKIISALKKSIAIDREDAESWDSLAVALVEVSRDGKNSTLLEEALLAAGEAARLGGSRYNFACALALTSDHEQALKELQGCLERGDISVPEILDDPDWGVFAEDLKFGQLLQGKDHHQ